jgi:NAD(P)H-dependent FMN reductase
MTEKIKVHIIMGSVRDGRFNEKATFWIADLAKKREDLDIEVVDLKAWPFPMYNEPSSPSQVKDGKYPSELATKWAAIIGKADAYIFVTPEYNHGMSGVLKNALDFVYAEWNNKAVGIVGYGSTGGSRAVAQLRASLPELQLASVRTAVHIMAPWMLVDENNQLKAGALDSYESSANTMLDQLTSWAHALKTVRA